MKRLKRLWQSFRFSLLSGSAKMKYAKTQKLFALYGNNVTFQPHLLPLYSGLIKIHDNVVVGRNVEFVTHDVIHKVINSSGVAPGMESRERIGCIEIMNNSFIGNGSIVMYGVRIAENNIIAAGSVVTKSTEPNSVYAGIPARKIGTFQDAVDKRITGERNGSIPTISINQQISDDEIAYAWKAFERQNDHNCA